MNCVILQPSYIPWRGFFHQIQKADIFVFYDDVQYDKRGWRNRNKIKTPNGLKWLTIPVHSRGAQVHNIPINQIYIDWNQEWNVSHLGMLTHFYRSAPFLDQYLPMLEKFYSRRDELLADFTIDFTKALATELGINHTKYIRSSDLGVDGVKTERLLKILKLLGASHYISGPSAQGYLEEELLNEAGITLEYMTYDYPEYPQLFPPYNQFVTILDLLFMKGPEASEYIWLA